MAERTSPLSKLLLVAVCVVASIAASVAATLWMRPDTTSDLPHTVPVDPARVDRLESRIEALERSAPELRSGAAAPPQPTDRNPIDSRDNALTLSNLEQRIRQLEHLRSRTENGALGQDRLDQTEQLKLVDEANRMMMRKAREEVIAMAEKVILDPRATAADKVNAHGLLRRVDDAYTPAMTQALVDIARTGDAPELRSRVWTLFDGASAAKLPELVPALTDSVYRDSSPQVRAEAAETLGNFPMDDRVVATLEHIAKNDDNERVRQKARRTLDEIKLQRAERAKRR